MNNYSIITILLSMITTLVAGQGPADLVKGNLIQFNDNGAWCWYQDERAVLDLTGEKLIVASDASGSGTGGSDRNGSIEVVIFDLETGTPELFSLMKAGCDDHNTPALLVRDDGKYIAMYAQHYDQYSRYRIFDGVNWSPQALFPWESIPGGTDFSTTYSNLVYLKDEGKVYNFVRCYAKSPNMMISENMGTTWVYGGLLTQPDESIGYVNGYFKYCGNGTDRIDFVCTEHHPRDFNTNIYHGYIKGGRTCKADGTVLDSVITDKSAPKPADFTMVFEAGTAMGNVTLTRCWTVDLQSYPDGSLATIISARENDDPENPSDDPDHGFIYSRFDGQEWQSTYLGKAGKKMYYSEQDYTGLGALDPDDPTAIYISTPYDPGDGTALGVREIFKGVTADSGKNWTWEAVTQYSTRDNFRPIVPAWDTNNTALLWWRGTYYSAQNFDAAVVGVLDRKEETFGEMQYIDASPANTVFHDGSPLVTTGPGPAQGLIDNQWHQRTGFGNSGTVYTSAEIGGEDAPCLKTRVTVPDTGTYDIWVNFWANPEADWRIKAGTSENNMQMFRQMASQQVEEGMHRNPVTLSGEGNVFLYQAYVGRISHPQDSLLEVFVDDHAIATGSTGTLTGDIARTWYDGISVFSSDTDYEFPTGTTKEMQLQFMLGQNYPNPFSSSTLIPWSIPEPGLVSLRIYDIQGREIAVLLNEYREAGSHSTAWNPSGEPEGIYICKLVSGSKTLFRKMILMH